MKSSDKEALASALRSMRLKQDIALTLRRLADRLPHLELVDITLTMERPERELDPMAGECSLDAYRHFALGDVETWTIRMEHARK